MVLDSNHSRAHVEHDLELYSEPVTPGCSSIACDDRMGGYRRVAHRTRFAIDRHGAIEAFPRTHPAACWRSSSPATLAHACWRNRESIPSHDRGRQGVGRIAHQMHLQIALGDEFRDLAGLSWARDDGKLCQLIALYFGQDGQDTQWPHGGSPERRRAMGLHAGG